MVVVRHISGPLESHEQAFDSRTDRITFGRRADCDVIFPADVTVVSREHFAIARKPSGSWVFESYGKPVFSNGQPLDNGEAIPANSVLELGRIGGPSFQLIINETPDDDLPLTDVQQKVVTPRTLARRNGKQIAQIAIAILF